MVVDVPGIVTLPEGSKPKGSRKPNDNGTNTNRSPGSGTWPLGKDLLPKQEIRANSGNPCKQTGCKNYLQGKTLNQNSVEMHGSINILMDQDGAMQPPSLDHPERFPGFRLLCEVTDENADTQIFILCS
jgi:hypothetical protein